MFHFNILDQSCKYRYVQQLRSLKTYGIIFFENCMMKKQMKNKKEVVNVMVPFKWGISKNRILKYEQDTGRELNAWPFGMLRKWVCCK
jgi:hypothetical protein